MPSYKPDLAYFDSMHSGLVPVTVTCYNQDGITCRVTASRGAYKKGETLQGSASLIYPREAIYIRSGKYRIRAYTWHMINGAVSYTIP